MFGKQPKNDDATQETKKTFFKSWKGKFFLVISGVVILAAIVGDSPEEKAKKAGFESVAQMESAQDLGILSGAEYQVYLTKKAEEKRLAEEKAAEEKRLAEEKAAEEKRLAEAEEKRKQEKMLKANLENAEWLVDDYNASIKGTFYCQKSVEKLAKFDFEWTDGWLDTKFPSYLTKTQRPGVVVLVGDKIKFQNGFGAWQKVKYYCAYDVINDKALDAWVR
jgi:hypothetical protein